MRCPNCGQEAQGKFCTKCGARMPADGGDQTVVDLTPFRDPAATSMISPADLRDAGTMSVMHPDDRPAFRPTPEATQAFRPAAEPAQVFSAPAMAPAAVLDRPSAPMASGYPVQVDFAVSASNSRFWAIPVLGIVAKAIVLIPHIIVLYALVLVVEALQLVTWIPVLFTGRYPTWASPLVVGTMSWAIRVYAFFFGLTDQYPPFGFAAPGYPVTVSIQVPPVSNRVWAIPLLGLLIKYILLIPHLIILWALGAVAGAILLVSWIPVLFGGRYPEWGYSLVGGYLRWSLRVGAYFLGLNDQYPPFQLAA